MLELEKLELPSGQICGLMEALLEKLFLELLPPCPKLLFDGGPLLIDLLKSFLHLFFVGESRCRRCLDSSFLLSARRRRSSAMPAATDSLCA